MGHCQAISISQLVALEIHQYDRTVDLLPKPEIWSKIHYRIPFRSSVMTKTKSSFQTQSRQKVFSAGKQCKWSELHAWSEPMLATIPVQKGLSWDRFIGLSRLIVFVAAQYFIQIPPKMLKIQSSWSHQRSFTQRFFVCFFLVILWFCFSFRRKLP